MAKKRSKEKASAPLPAENATVETRVEKENLAVVVVHGVGETRPGSTLDALLPTMANSNKSEGAFQQTGRTEIHRLPDLPHDEPNSDSKVLPTFPVHCRTMTHGNRSISFFELYWADLSAIPAGWFSVIWGVFRIMLNLHHIADEAAADNTLRVRLLRLCLFSVSWLLRGPIAAFVSALFVLVAWQILIVEGIVEPLLSERVMLSNYFMDGGFALVGAFVAYRAFGKWRQQHKRENTLSSYFFWLFIVGICCIAMAVLRLLQWSWLLQLCEHAFESTIKEPNLRNTLWCYVTIILMLLTRIWAAVVVAALVGFFLWLWARFSRKIVASALNVAFSATVIQLFLWSFVVPLIGGVLLIQIHSTGRSNGLLQVFEPVWLGLFTSIPLIFVLGLFVVAATFRWSQQVRRGNDSRLIVHPLILWPLNCLLLVAGLYFLGTLTGLFPFLQRDYLGVTQERVYSILGVVVTLLLSLVFWKGDKLRSAIHVIMDVCNHFYRSRLPVPWPWNGPNNDGNARFPTRARIEARLWAIIRHCKFHKLNLHGLIAHSQGSVIAMDVLCSQLSNGDSAGNDALKYPIHLVTLGSPITHLYQEYFPHQYPKPNIPSTQKTYWNDMQGKIIWTNIYRRDDFIGTYVDKPNGSDYVTNNRLGLGGHENYWIQINVAQKILDVLFPSEKSSGKPPANPSDKTKPIDEEK